MLPNISQAPVPGDHKAEDGQDPSTMYRVLPQTPRKLTRSCLQTAPEAMA
jgi:hypothetical protein